MQVPDVRYKDGAGKARLGTGKKKYFVHRGHSNSSTRTAPRMVLYSWAKTYRRALGRCVSLISSNPCIAP